LAERPKGKQGDQAHKMRAEVAEKMQEIQEITSDFTEN